MEDRITLAAIERMRVRAAMEEQRVPSTMFVYRACPQIAQEFTEALGAEYAPVNGEQVVGDYLVVTVEPPK